MPDFDELLDSNLYGRQGMFLEDFWMNNFGVLKVWICPTAPPGKKSPSPEDWNYRFTPGGLYKANTFRVSSSTTGKSTVRDYSYALNGAFDEGRVNLWIQHNDFSPDFLPPFVKDADLQHPAQTPVWGDGLYETVIFSSRTLLPGTLYPSGDSWWSDTFFLPRHGWSANGVVPDADFLPDQKLPGGINFFYSDGHVQQVQLERLWYQAWHRNYNPPVKRPGT